MTTGLLLPTAGCALYTPLFPSAGTLPANAQTGLLFLCAGLLLIYLECNRPGWVIPGATGLLLFLLGVHALSRVPLRPGALLLITLAIVVLALPLRLRSAWAPLLAGTTLLTLGMARLLAGQSVSITGGGCGLLLGPASAWLAIVAGRARRAKQQVSRTSTQRSATTSRDIWE